MQITQCLHVAILVSDLERSELFYGNVLGLSKVDRVLKFPGVWYQIGNFQIHLIVDPQVSVSLQNEEKWGRNQHLAFSVSSVDNAKQKLLDNGYSVQMSASGRAALFTRDPDGNIIELNEG